MNMTTVKIKIVDPQGSAYEGAIIKAHLDKPFFYDGIYVNNYEYREFTNSFGNAELELVPSTLDPSGENFYYLEIVYDTVILKKVIVPQNNLPLTLNDLEDYKYPYERDDFIGDCDSRF